jgi:hypothetical protein
VGRLWRGFHGTHAATENDAPIVTRFTQQSGVPSSTPTLSPAWATTKAGFAGDELFTALHHLHPQLERWAPHARDFFNSMDVPARDCNLIRFWQRWFSTTATLTWPSPASLNRPYDITTAGQQQACPGRPNGNLADTTAPSSKSTAASASGSQGAR